MFDHFRLAHTPALFVASAMTFGGLWPFFDARAATAEMGLPARFSAAHESRTIFQLCAGRTTALGMVLFTLYFQRRLAEVDTVMVVLGAYVGAVDGYVFWREGCRGKGVQRAVSGLVIAACGWYGLVAGR